MMNNKIIKKGFEACSLLFSVSCDTYQSITENSEMYSGILSKRGLTRNLVVGIASRSHMVIELFLYTNFEKHDGVHVVFIEIPKWWWWGGGGGGEKKN
jgi:hypothetical protein